MKTEHNSNKPVLRPPLNALRAFEAAARLGSMKLAGIELGVTHGAISRQIQLLEGIVGVMLLRRLPKSVEATAEGARLAASLSAAFNLISTGLAQLQPGPLTISCSSTIMQNWLIPRLGRFKARYPDIELSLNVNYSEVDLVREEISLAIRNDMIPAPEDVVLQHLMREEIGLVCSPEFAASHALQPLENLRNVPILSTKTRPAVWSDWLDAIGAPQHPLHPHQVFEHFYLMIQAASFGLGAAVAPRMIVEGEMAAGRLVAPYGFVPGPYNIVLWIAPHLRADHGLRTVVNWIREEMACQALP
jgi:LysR family transcriptional regulator, glycine cleavage system transcriptional activator